MGEEKERVEHLAKYGGSDDAAFRDMMERIEKSNAGQEKYARRQYRMSQITALASILILAVVIYTASILIPKINVTYQNIQLILEDMRVITSELADAELDQMIGNIDHLVVSSEKNINDALVKVNSIDIEELNRAIQNLSDVVEPLAQFFGRFR